MRALDYGAYARLSDTGSPVPVFREIPGDLHTPVSAYRSLAAGAERSFLLESVVGGEHVARYSFLGRDPDGSVEVVGGRLVEDGVPSPTLAPADLLDVLRRRQGVPLAEVPGLPRFLGGAVGYLSYDAVRLFESVPDRHRAAHGRLASFAVYRDVVAFDHARQRLVLVAHAEPGGRAAWADAVARLDALESDLHRAEPAGSAAPRAAPGGEPVETRLDPGSDAPAFRAAVRAAQEHIACGDCYQVVLSRRLSAPAPDDPFAAYRALRMVNPSPYMYFVREGERAIAGASPEMLVRVEGRRAETRPLAGTRPRGADAAEDERLGRELLADDKERAEHVMLVDLGRNDLGRVCRTASVAVDEFMGLERYSHVTHIVSSVSGELRPDRDALDALVAAFPAGTLSGAPKRRAMEIIDALEPSARGLYGGALGYLDSRGHLDFCIAIRTLVMESGRALVQAGAGIVADSDPDAELRETEAKAGALLEALRLAGELR